MVEKKVLEFGDLKERRDLFGYAVEELRGLVQDGIDSGPSPRATMADVKAEARRRFRS